MNRLLWFFILLLTLSACLEQEDDNNHGYGYGYDVELESGMRVQYHGDAAVISAEELNDAYNETVECVGLPAPAAPLVAFVDEEINSGSEYLIQGRIYLDTGLIVVMSLNEYSEDWTILVLQHEIIHYLLWLNNVSDSANMNHESELFGLCSY